MYGETNSFNSHSKMATIKTYMKCNSFLKQMLQEIEIEPIVVSGGPKATNLALVQQVKALLDNSNKNKLAEISGILDPEKNLTSNHDKNDMKIILTEKLNNILDFSSNSDHVFGTPGLMIDDISPNAFKQSLATVAEKYLSAGQADIVAARELFRRVLDNLRTQNVVRRRINVVASNFPRMYSYLLECYEDNIGLSAYGRGKNLNTAKVKIGQI